MMIKEMPFLVFMGSFLDSFVKLSLIMILMKYKNIYIRRRFWIATLLLGTYVFFSYMITDNFIKLILLFLLTIIVGWYILKFDSTCILKIAITTFFVWLIIVLSDIFFGILVEGILKLNMNKYRENGYIVLIINCLVFLLVSFVFSVSRVRKLIYNISSHFTRNTNYYIVVVIVLSVILFSTVFYICYFNYNIVTMLITVFIMTLVYTVVTIVTIKEFNQKNKIQSEYDILLTNLAEYENLLDIQRISNHENKNQLLVIKGMLNKNENNVLEYIDSIIDTQYADNDILIMKTNKIPSGGLKGLIYYKLLTMKAKNIDINLDVFNNLKQLDFSKISTKTNQELCKIVGVFLDNAIQAVESIDNRKINIMLDYLDNQLIIKISNSYNGIIEFDKIEVKGYTTKGKGHGYGLSLVNNIIKNNPNFSNEKEINGRLFSQIVKLKI